MKRNKTTRERRNLQQTKKSRNSGLVELTPKELDQVSGGSDPELIVGN